MYIKMRKPFLDVIASPSSYVPPSVGQSVQWVSELIDSFRFGDSYRISELCKLVKDVRIV